MRALALALGLVWMACWPPSPAQTALPAGAQEQDAAMVKLLRPYLDDAYTPADGPDTDKELIREFVRRIGEALPDKLAVKPSRPRRVLVVTQRTMGALHSPGAAGLLILLRKSAEKHKAFELAELTSDKPVTGEMLARFDAVVINNQSLPGDPRFHRELLPEYVRNGGGLFAVHAAALIDSTGETNTEYNRLLGAYVDRSARYGHPGNHHSVFPIRLPLPNHPLARAFRGEEREYQLTYQELLGQRRRNYAVRLTAPRQLADELYVLLPAPGAADKPLVVVEIDARNSAVVYPPQCDPISHAITWIKPYGKGRVFYTQLGHNLAVFSIDTVARALLDGLQYAIGDLKADDEVRQEPFVVRNPAAFHRIVPEEARLETIGRDLGDAEGPVWIGGDDGYLVFSDIKADKLLKWSPAAGLETFRESSNRTNGNALDPWGRLISCEQAARRLVRAGVDGRRETLADRFQGKRLNSPNDLAVRSDGTIWFSDPAYGPVAGGKELDGNYVFRIDPRSGEVSIASKELSMPNGICLSPDERTLYVGQGGAGRYIKRFKINEDGTLAAGEVLCVVEGGVPDGLKCDRDGNLYVAGTGGVQIFAPDGQPIGAIRVPPTAAERPRVTNLCFGGEGGKVLFITARSSLFRIGLKVAGHFPGANRR